MSVTVHTRGYEADRVQASVIRLLAANTLCSMASRSEAGAIHISIAYYSYNADLVLHFLSHPESVHCHNLTRSPQAAVAVFDSRQPWGAPHAGLQMFGAVATTPAPEVADVGAEYAARFPRYSNLARRATGAAPESQVFAALRFYSFTPERVQLLDEWEFGEEVFLTATLLRR
jgi:hypothetical protein